MVVLDEPGDPRLLPVPWIIGFQEITSLVPPHSGLDEDDLGQILGNELGLLFAAATGLRVPFAHPVSLAGGWCFYLYT